MWIKFLFSDERWVNHLGHQKWHDTYFWFSEEVAHISRSCSHCLCHWMLPFFRTSVTYKGVDVDKVFVSGREVALMYFWLRGACTFLEWTVTTLPLPLDAAVLPHKRCAHSRNNCHFCTFTRNRSDCRLTLRSEAFPRNRNDWSNIYYERTVL